MEVPVGKKDLENLTLKEKEAILKAEEVYKKGLVSVQDIIAPAALKINPDHIILGTKYARTIFLVTYPRYLMTGWFAPIINLNVALDIAMFIEPMSSATVLKTLRSKAAQVQAGIAGNIEKGMVRDPILDAALQDVETLRDKLTAGTERFFRFGLYVTIYAKDTEELEKITTEIETMLGHKLVMSRRAVFQGEQGFNSTLPFGLDDIGVTLPMNTGPLSTSFPFVSSELTSDKGILYGINRHNNSLVLFDRFSLPNANSCIFGIPGAGKSYAVKLEILRSMMFGTDVIVIDPENEYQHLAEAVGGTYLRISLGAKYFINPFDLPKPQAGESAEDIIRSAVINLKGLMKIIMGRMTKEEEALVDKALLETYAAKDITAESDLSKVVPPTMEDFEAILSGMAGGEDLALRLQKYTKGTFSGLFNKPTNVEMKQQLVVFSIRDLEDELRPVAMYIILNYIWNMVRSELKKRILAVDEAWIMMRYEDSAWFLYGLIKRARKYYLGVTVISQDVTDFLTSDHGKAVITNSAMRVLFKQSPAAIDLLKKTFYLTEEEKYLLLESNVGEGIFFAGAKHVAIKVVASYQEDQIITTDPRQLLEIEKAKEEFAEAEKEA